MSSKLVAAALCSLIGAGAAAFVWVHADHMADLGPHGPAIIGASMLTFFLFGMAGFLLFISWRDGGRTFLTSQVNPGSTAELQRLGLKAGVYGLVPGTTYRVIRTITDCYNDVFPVGAELTFVQRHYLPYHGGHTVVFRPRPMYLQDETNADVLNALETYLEVASNPVMGNPAGRPLV